MIHYQKTGFSMIRSRKNSVFWWSVLKKTAFLTIRSRTTDLENLFFTKSFFQKRFLSGDFRKGLEKTRICSKNWSKNLSQKNRGKDPAKKQLGQKAKPSPTTNRYKFQNNNARASGARPIFGVVVLKFEPIFCRTWLGFLAELFLAGFLPLIFWDRFLDRFFEQIFVFFQTFFESLLAETFFGKIFFLVICWSKLTVGHLRFFIYSEKCFVTSGFSFNSVHPVMVPWNGTGSVIF